MAPVRAHTQEKTPFKIDPVTYRLTDFRGVGFWVAINYVAWLLDKFKKFLMVHCHDSLVYDAYYWENINMRYGEAFVVN